MSDSSTSVTLNINNDRKETIYIYFSNTANSITGQTSDGEALKISNSSGSNTAEAYEIQAGKTFSCNISQFSSGRVGFSLDKLTYGNMKEFNNSNSATNYGDFTLRYDKFEMDVQSGTANCDLTALDWVALPFVLTTSDASSAVSSGGWSEAFTSFMSKLANNAVVEYFTNQNGSAIITGNDGVSTTITAKNETLDIVRVIGPNTAVGSGDTPYNTIVDGLNALKGKTDPIHIKGNGYDMKGNVNSDGSISLSGTLNGSASQTMKIGAADLTSIGIYEANPQHVSINGGDEGAPSGTVENAACRDVYAGLNLGAWGSTTPITTGAFTGSQVGQLNSEQLMAFGASLTASEILTYFFKGAQPNNPTYYNESAMLICEGSTNSIYGFPYSDYLGGQLMYAGPGKTLTLSVIGDDATASPA